MLIRRNLLCKDEDVGPTHLAAARAVAKVAAKVAARVRARARARAAAREVGLQPPVPRPSYTMVQMSRRLGQLDFPSGLSWNGKRV